MDLGSSTFVNREILVVMYFDLSPHSGIPEMLKLDFCLAVVSWILFSSWDPRYADLREVILQ